LAAKPVLGSTQDDLLKEVEMSTSNFGKSCGVCHVGGGQMEYDSDMKAFGDPSSTDASSLLTYRINRIEDGSIVPGSIVSTSTNSNRELYGDNKAEVDCLMCHMNGLKTGAAWYKSLGCGPAKPVGPANDPTCSGPEFAAVDNSGGFYDSFNRNIAVSLGYFKQAASAGIGALINLLDGTMSNVPSSVSGGKIAAAPNSENCAMCHARTNSDSIGLPMEAAQYGGMVTGFGNFFRMTEAGKAFDFDKIATDGSCSGDCSNTSLWNEFGCKTGMGKRAQRSGVGTQDRFGFGICLGCATFNAMSGDMTTGWFGNGVCAMPSVQAACNTAAGTTLQGSAGQWMGILENPMTMLPKKVVGKMSDTDVHDAAGMKCSTCHYALSGDGPAARTVGSGANLYTIPQTTGMNRMDHQMAQGWSTLEKANDSLDGTVTCESCHTERTHPNAGAAPNPGHIGLPALHLERIDCRTCHIPAVYSSPGRLLFRDWTAGAYRQTDGSNGNANHFDFAFNFMEGSAMPMAPMKVWIKVQEPAGDVYKIAPGLSSLLPVWFGKMNAANASPLPMYTRDVTAAAALVAANHPELGIRLNGTNEHPLFQGFQLTDPMKIESATKIALMRTELQGTGGGLATHNAYANPQLNLQPFFFDPSHGITSKTVALGANGCTDCHSTTSQFFNGSKDLLKNGMMAMADYDCGGDDTHQLDAANYGNTPGGWPNSDGGMCAMFDNPAMGGNGSGFCDPAELQACKTYIGSNLFQQFGMPGDIATAFPIDGIDMMQMQAIQEGATAAGCNPIYSFFGFPNAGRMTAPGSMTNGTGPTNGCIAADYYSRDDIRKHYSKNLQQVNDGTGNKVFGRFNKPATGSLAIGGTPALAAYDLGTTCVTNRQTGATGPCTDGGYISTTVTEKQLLGYNDADFAKLTNFSTMQATDACTNCHTQSLTSMNHPSGTGTPSSCAACHLAGTPAMQVHVGVPINVQTACGQCHGGSAGTGGTTNGAPYFIAAQLDQYANNIHGVSPVARFTWSTSSTVDYLVLYDASATTCPTGGTCTYSWSTGETGITTSHPFTSNATTTVTLTVTSSLGGSDSTSLAVTPKYVAGNPTSLDGSLSVVTTGFTSTVGWTVSGGVAPYTIRANWGDGQINTISSAPAGAGSLGHTYVTAGTYTVTVSATDTGVGGSNMTTAVKNAKVMIASVTVSGLVTNATGSVLSNVSMTLSGAKTYLATTDATGNYTFPNVSPGTYTMTAVKTGYTFNVPAATGIAVDGTTNVTVPQIKALGVADTINIAGKVTQSNGTTPIGSASLVLRTSAGVFKALGSTNSSGNYTFKNVANGDYTITAVKTGYTFTTQSVTVSGASVTKDFSSVTP
jgi:hypothetical protein